jgi:hypothetical protein
MTVAFLVHSMIPRGVFGAYDIEARAVVVGGSAYLTALLCMAISKRLGRQK